MKSAPTSTSPMLSGPTRETESGLRYRNRMYQTPIHFRRTRHAGHTMSDPNI